MPHFNHISVLTLPDNRKVIHWVMDRNFVVPAGYNTYFYVDWARSGGPWTCLNPSAPVVNDCFFTDPTRYCYAMERNLFYHVRVVLRPAVSDSSSSSADSEYPWETYTSLPEQELGVIHKENLLIAREIVRKEYLRLKKKGGRQGFLLKRKEWGTRCPTCTDFDVGEVINGSCPICFGTGIVGGYYPGIEYWVETTPNKRNQATTEQGIGVTNQQVLTGRAVAYPWISSMDLWVDAETNERFIIRAIQHLAEMEGKPLVLGLELRRLPDTDISKDVPIESPTEDFEIETQECPSETVPVTEKMPDDMTDIVKSIETTDDKGWRRGLEEENF